MGAADLTYDFEARGRRYRIDFTESLMVEYVNLCEVRRKKDRDLLLHGKRWTAEALLALIPGSAGDLGPAAIAKKVKEAMDAGWNPLK